MPPHSLQGTPTRAPYNHPNQFVKPLPPSAITDSTNINGKHQSTTPTQRPMLQPKPTPGSSSAPKPFNGEDMSQQGSGFNIHRPSGAGGRQSVPRPALQPQKTSQQGLSQQVGGGSAAGKPNGSSPQRPHRPVFTQPNVARPPTGPRAQHAAPVVAIPPHWTNHASAKFRLRGVPGDWTTREVHRQMLSLGNVVEIDMPAEQPRVAYVTFIPPPQDYRRIADGMYLEIKTAAGLRTYNVDFEWKHPDPNRIREAPDATVNAARIDFGVMKSANTMLGLHSIKATPEDNVEISVFDKHKKLEIQFAVPTALMSYNRKVHHFSERLQYRMQINFAQISSIVHMQNYQTGEMEYVLSVEAPPIIHRRSNKPLETHEPGQRKWKEQFAMWYRQTEIEQNLDVARHAKRQLQRDNPIIDLGRWLSYRITFDAKTSSSAVFRELKNILEASISVTKDRMIHSEFKATKAMVMWSWLDSPVAALKQGNDMSSLSDLQQMAHQTIQLPFEVRYQLESAISHGCIHECNIDQEFLQKLSDMATENEYGKRRARKLLEKVVDEGTHFYHPMDIFKKVVPNMHKGFQQKERTTHFVKVLTATITPTAIYFNTASFEPSNRVIRHYRQHEDRFLRVRFTEEKYKGKIYGSEDAQNNEIFTRVKRTMTNGIKVGDRIFEFLAFGNSQFRENGAYFFAPIGDLNAHNIRAWMGDFTHIKVVAKYCSRIGQALSTTRATQKRQFKEIKIPDIERNKFCFTDGVGKISPLLATFVANEIGMLTPKAGTRNINSHVPSAYQFRMGGCKGVLVVDPTMGPEMSVAIRPSQEKFSMTKHTGLEICRIAQFTNCSLNVQIILILSGLGIGDNVFLSMMRETLSDLELAMTDEEKAKELLQKNIDFNQMTVQVAQMIQDGFMARQDPFTISCLRLWRSWSLKYLKEKQRLFVEDGAFVLGCIDETATLEGHYNDKPDELPEIFLQIPDREKEGQYRVIEGICMLARNPSLHPGDIRIVRAVRCLPLMHIRDCVVLPQKGDRDLANMCSGGDLDGDDYIIIWDKNLLPPQSEWNHSPMDYQAPDAVETKGEITMNDMTSFFVTHMKYDNVGRIATLHRCWADSEPEGVKSAKCLKLAELHSQAVDYAKTGKPAELPRALYMSKRPHWLGKPNFYVSQKIIGQLYDMVKRVDFFPAWEMPFDKRILNAYQLDDMVLDQARDVKEQYDEEVRRVMAKYNIRSEFEVWTTFVLEHCEDFNDYKFGEKIGEEVYTLKERFRKLCEKYFWPEEETQQKDPEKKRGFIAAMYTITADEVSVALQECEEVKVVGGMEVPKREFKIGSMPLMSFPWLFPAELGAIANEREGLGAGLPVRTGASARELQREKEKMKREMLGDVPAVEPLEEIGGFGESDDEGDGVLWTGPGASEGVRAPGASVIGSTSADADEVQASLMDLTSEPTSRPSSSSSADSAINPPIRAPISTPSPAPPTQDLSRGRTNNELITPTPPPPEGAADLVDLPPLGLDGAASPEPSRRSRTSELTLPTTGLRSVTPASPQPETTDFVNLDKLPVSVPAAGLDAALVMQTSAQESKDGAETAKRADEEADDEEEGEEVVVLPPAGKSAIDKLMDLLES